ncbi:MAG: proline--tRNA ligase [Firmicutes bacterium]|nr:proline--tRNA ligase [Bacillota bacterium]
MKMSKMYIRTLREVPAEAELPSHVLMLRSGMIRKIVSGVYGYMPLGKRVLNKVENIVREEMDAAGGQEILMSAIQPAELWVESGRWGAYGPEMWRVKDRNSREFCLGPTHEEIFTDIIRNEVSSYRQLPVNLYQIQTKYRDEARPRFGLMRSREFIMKDAYSFDRDQEGLDASYQNMYDTYTRIFNRCGLKFAPVEADTGAIGGSDSHEFTAFAENGESQIVYCEKCNMAATDERAECVDAPASDAAMLAAETVHTPGTKTIEEVANFLGLEKSQTIKALLYETLDDDYNVNGYVAAFVRGDREVNEIKIINLLGIPEHALVMANEEKMAEVTGCVGGFTGPVGLKNCKIIVDSEIPGLRNLCAGANQVDHHTLNLNYGRDFEADIVANIKMIAEGDPCPVCGAPVKFTRGIEVGQVFKLGTKYSEAMGATYKDENMKDQVMVMGCYGIGVSRTMAAIVEQYHDDNGIVWPIPVAPYHVTVTVVKAKDADQMALAEKIEAELSAKGIEVVVDDRDERPGVKFKDADLIGFPVRIVVGKKAAEGIVEYKLRTGGDAEEVTAEEAVSRASELILTALNAHK